MNGETSVLIKARAMLPGFASDDYISDPLDLDIHAATLTCVVGPDRSGKTRYMRTLAGIDPPVEGEVVALGLDSSDLERGEWRQLRARIGYIGSETTLLPTLDGLRNVVFPALYHRLGGAVEIEERARRLLEELRVRQYTGVLPASMSGVQRNKLILARSLLLEPKVLFLDDPYKLVDVLAVVELNEFLLEWMKKKGISIVMATDDLEFGEKHGDQTLFIARGIVCRFESMSEFRQSPYPEVKRFMNWIEQD